ncbi:MAG: hypothetical protein OEP95_09495 [Myxococcales bacterium]|nr:hypothetical protein [Myxococcales bacterium]
MSSPGRRALPWIAPALLALLAALQILLVHHANLSPWKGGGYGMFSTTDHGGFRTIRAFAVDGSSEQRLSIPPELRSDVLRALDLPSDERLEDLAASLARQNRASRVRAEVWRLKFDDELQPELRPLSSAESGP